MGTAAAWWGPFAWEDMHGLGEALVYSTEFKRPDSQPREANPPERHCCLVEP